MWRWKCFVCGRVYLSQWQGWLSWHTFLEECPECGRLHRRAVNTLWPGRLARDMTVLFIKAFVR